MRRTLRRATVLATGFFLWTIVGVRDAGSQGPPSIPPHWLEPAGPFQMAMVGGREVVANEVLVKFANPTPRRVQQAADSIAARSYRTVGRGQTLRMHSATRTVEQMMADLSLRADVEYVEPNYVIRATQIAQQQIPSDTFFGEQWGLRNTGQAVAGVSGIPDADIDADEAWSLTTGSASIVVGVLDTGVDLDPNRTELAGNLWSAPAAFSVTIGGQAIQCAPGAHGFNVLTRTCDPRDDNGHGTYVSGVIGAVGNDGTGIAGVNWTTSLLSLKVLDGSGIGTTVGVIDAIEFAIQARQYFSFDGSADVRVLSASWGGTGYSQALENEIYDAYQAGIIFVAAAGNSSSNSDVIPNYPAGFNVPGLISVAATGSTDDISTFSNYGVTTVDLAAPGERILSTIMGTSPYAYGTGTSAAAPHVSGAAALILSACNLSPAELRDLILATVDPLDSLRDKTVSGGRLNVANAIRLCQPQNPTFTLSVQPRAITVNRGDDAVFRLDVRSWFGFSNTVDLSIFPPAGATFAPASIQGGSGSSTLTLDTSLLNLGSKTYTLTASSGGLVRQADVTLDVSTTAAVPTPIACKTPVVAAITASDPYSVLRTGTFHDRYSFDVTEAGFGKIFMGSKDFQPYMYVLDSNGTVIDQGSVIWTNFSPGSYVVEATTYSPGDTGNYKIDVSCPGTRGRDDIIVDFGSPYGTWIWKNDSAWVQLHQDSPPGAIVTGDFDGGGLDEIVVDFGDPHGIWAWVNDMAWVQVHGTSPEDMIFANHFGPDGHDELIIEFSPPDGIWSRSDLTGARFEMSHMPAEAMVAGDVLGNGLDLVFIDTGPYAGIEVFKDGYLYHQLHSYDPESMAVGDLDGNGRDELIVDFGDPWGIWIAENYTQWVQLHNFTPLSMVTGDLDGNGQDEVIIDFGPPWGIYIWENNSAWVPLHWFSPGTKMVTGDLDGNGQDEVVIDFGYPYGIYVWKNNTQWVQLHGTSAVQMVVGDIDGS